MQVGRLLRSFSERIESAKSERARMSVQMAVAADSDPASGDPTVNLLFQAQRIKAEAGEPWKIYKDRVLGALAGPRKAVEQVIGVKCKARVAANTLTCRVPMKQAVALGKHAPDLDLKLVELDPFVDLCSMDDAVDDIGLATFEKKFRFAGRGVRVAIIDSGVDEKHPYLQVHNSISTCDEIEDIPGRHGTHCAGSIASTHPLYRGVAPEVLLINIKALRSNGTGNHDFITAGIDAALDADAEVLSMSIGFNHLPAWSDGGHGWECRDGTCPLCSAVDTAATTDRRIVVVAAGNEHIRADTLRQRNLQGEFDTELGCPGQARTALTVGAHTKQTFHRAPFSSLGPASYPDAPDKPDIYAPGVNITSTIPVPRDAKGEPLGNLTVSRLFGRLSGTSMATPIVAGAACLLVQLYGIADRDRIVAELVARSSPMADGPTGRLDLSGL